MKDLLGGFIVVDLPNLKSHVRRGTGSILGEVLSVGRGHRDSLPATFILRSERRKIAVANQSYHDIYQS